jgi:molybdopterin-biosynthesis enzyme MoeA-like protein
MARIPQGADLVANPISKAPGFRLGNVFVMAGVPAIMQAMLDNVAPGLAKSEPVISETLDAAGLPEGLYAAPLAEIAKRYPGLSIGSYPSYSPAGFTNQIVARGRDRSALDQAAADIRAMVDRLRLGES